MKLRLLLGILLTPLIAFTLSANDVPELPDLIPEITLLDGQTLHQVQIKSLSKQGVLLRHAGGIAQINYEKLPPDLRAQLILARDTTPIRVNHYSSAPAPTPVAPRTQPTPANTATIPTGTAQGLISRTINGHRLPIPNVTISILPLADLLTWDQARRASLPPAHTAMIGRILNLEGNTAASQEDILSFQREELASWANLPRSPWHCQSRDDGRFTISVPFEGDYALVAWTGIPAAENAPGTCMLWVTRIGPEQAISLNAKNTQSFLSPKLRL